jgi:hypothetical protein
LDIQREWALSPVYRSERFSSRPTSNHPLDIPSFINEHPHMYEIRLYISEDAKDLYLNWCLKLRDFKVRIAIDRRVNRLELGNFGDHKF